MSHRKVLITGANGGIGTALCDTFSSHGWFVIATDISDHQKANADSYISMDLNTFCTDDNYRLACSETLRDVMSGGLDCLVNNAAHQVVGSVEDISMDAWQRTFNTNVTAPFFLVKAFHEELKAQRGNVINVTSVHAKLTKRSFAAYAASKSALEGLTRSLGVELGKEIRVNAIAPAAISTPMLQAGFESTSRLQGLAGCHPTNTIGQPEDVAELALYIAQSKSGFLNGAVINLDGGISSRLYDPE